MAPDCTDQTKWNSRHDDGWLHVRFQWNRKKRKDHEQRQSKATLESTDCISLFRLNTFKGIKDTRVLGEYLWEDAILEIGNHLSPGGDTGVNRCCDVNSTISVDASDRCEATTRFNFGDLTKGYFSTVRCSNPHVFEIAKRTTIRLWIPDHHADIVASSLYALGFFAIERLSDLAPEVLQRKPQGFCIRLNAEFEFFFSSAKRIRNLVDTCVFC